MAHFFIKALQCHTRMQAEELSMFTPVQKAPYLPLLRLILSAEQAHRAAVKRLFPKSERRGGQRQEGWVRWGGGCGGCEVLGHLFWRKRAKSGPGGSTVNLL